MFVLTTSQWGVEPQVLGVYATEQEAKKAKYDRKDESEMPLEVSDLEELRIRLKDVRKPIGNYAEKLAFKTSKREDAKADVANLDKYIIATQRQLQWAAARRESLLASIRSFDSAIGTIRERLDKKYPALDRLESRQQLLLKLARNELQEHRDAIEILDAYARNMAVHHDGDHKGAAHEG